jgi:hypothetical protein
VAIPGKVGLEFTAVRLCPSAAVRSDGESVNLQCRPHLTWLEARAVFAAYIQGMT